MSQPDPSPSSRSGAQTTNGRPSERFSSTRTGVFVIVSTLISGIVIGLTIGLLVGKSMSGTSTQVDTAPSETVEAVTTVAAVQPETTTTLPTGQIHALSLGSVVEHEFRPEKQTTGKIANDDDLTTPVFSLVGGHALKLVAQPGEVVKAGSPLVEIDSPDMFQAETALITAIPALNKARLTLEQLKRIEARQQRLYDLNAIALKDYEQSQADERSAETDVKAAEAALEAARGQLRIFGRTEAELTALEQGGLPSRMATVRAPIDGTVVSRKIGTGQIVRPDNSDPMFTIADLSTVWMTADLYETDARWIAIGQPVEVRVMAFPDEVYPATISYINPYVDSNTHRITVRCTVANKDGKLKPEMFATFRVFSLSKVLAPAVPTAAVIHVGGSTYVWTVHDENRFTKHQVECSAPQDGFVQILSGLKSGERIVMQGGIFLDSQ